MTSKTGEPRVPMTLQKLRLKAEEKILDFDFELVNVQFNETGKYALRLTVENPLLEGSGAGVQLRVNEGNPIYTNTATTDVIEQSNLNDIFAFEKRRFLFTLPKGFCKNDKNHDARLRIEVLRLHGSLLKTNVKVGEAFFAIYPRTNQPRMNLFASKDEDLYRYSDIMALLRAGKDELAMHCGRLAYAVSFHEHRPVAKRETPISFRHLTPFPPVKQEGPHAAENHSPVPFHILRQSYPVFTPETSLQLPSPMDSQNCGMLSQSEPAEPAQEAPVETGKDFVAEGLPSSLPSSSSSSPALPRRLPSDASLHLPSPGYSPELAFEDTFWGVQKKADSGRSRKRNPFSLFSWGTKKVKEDPAGQGEPVLSAGINNWHVANSEKDAVTITLHGAANLPSTRKGHVPHPYVVVKTTLDEETKQPAQGVTHTSAQPTHAPTWEEKVTVEIEAQKSGDEDLSIIIADKDTKEILARYNIPVKYLRPFHHYHCALVLPRKKDPTGTKLYATIVRKCSLIPRYVGMNYTGLEVFLKGMNEALAQPDGSVLAIARIVNNVKAYKDEMTARSSDAPPVPLTIANFPDPPLEAFDVPRVTNHGYPQVSPPGLPPEQPVWNTSFLFQGRDGATAFSDDTALVIEYYKSSSEAVVPGKPKPLGFSILPLTNRVYRRLEADSSRNGVQIESLPIQNTDLRTTSGEAPTVQLGLQLIHSERPDTVLTRSIVDSLPLLDPKVVGQLGNIKEPWMRPSSKADEKTGVICINLEENRFLLPDRKKSCLDLAVLHKDEINAFPSHDAVAEILPDKQMLTRPIIQEVQDQQNLEVDNYRTAMQRMADDLLSLRRHVANLESENSTLRRNLTVHEDVGRTLLQDMDVEVMTKAEIVDRIMALKQKLSAGTREMAKMKDRVQRLQNELIRKNDREKDLMMLQRAHQQQQMVLRKYQLKIAKMKALEDAVRQQEKVIERMERMLEEKVKDHVKDPSQYPDIPQGMEKYPVQGDAWSRDLYSTLMMENMRLRDELGKSCYRSSPIILQQQALPDVFSSNSEKLTLLSKLEKAEARIHALEYQLEESARKWGRQKQDYGTRLLEYSHGFGRSVSSLLLPDFTLEEKEGKGDEEETNAKRSSPNSPTRVKTIYPSLQ